MIRKQKYRGWCRGHPCYIDAPTTRITGGLDSQLLKVENKSDKDHFCFDAEIEVSKGNVDLLVVPFPDRYNIQEWLLVNNDAWREAKLQRTENNELYNGQRDTIIKAVCAEAGVSIGCYPMTSARKALAKLDFPYSSDVDQRLRDYGEGHGLVLTKYDLGYACQAESFAISKAARGG